MLSSLWEGFGMVLVEALNMNTPIISTDCTMGPREILAPNLKIEEKIQYPYKSDYGILIDSKNTKKEKSLLEATEMILSKKISYNGMSRAKYFDIKNITPLWLKIIQK